MLTIPHCLGNRLTGADKVVSPIRRPRSAPHKHYFSASGTRFCSRLSEAQDLVRPEGLVKLKKIHSRHRVSNPHSSLITVLLRAPNEVSILLISQIIYNLIYGADEASRIKV
jgi:hypothetical protein